MLAGHPAVAECAVIGVHDELKGQVPRGFVVLKSGAQVDPEQLRSELVAAVRDQIGPVAAFRDVDVVDGLPKTRSGKILRKSMREIADTGEAKVPSTIEDPEVLERLRTALSRFVAFAESYAGSYAALLRSGSTVADRNTDSLVERVRDHVVALFGG